MNLGRVVNFAMTLVVMHAQSIGRKSRDRSRALLEILLQAPLLVSLLSRSVACRSGKRASSTV
ncbi:MAG TPA: hypothetical protein VK550_11785 [Polyangiaceae bacterium]|nr:hypothetical protein [Polyangiaceae bacterium]